MKNKEYEILLSKFYDLDIEKKKKEIYYKIIKHWNNTHIVINKK